MVPRYNQNNFPFDNIQILIILKPVTDPIITQKNIDMEKYQKNRYHFPLPESKGKNCFGNFLLSSNLH